MFRFGNLVIQNYALFGHHLSDPGLAFDIQVGLRLKTEGQTKHQASYDFIHVSHCIINFCVITTSLFITASNGSRKYITSIYGKFRQQLNALGRLVKDIISHTLYYLTGFYRIIGYVHAIHHNGTGE